MARVGAPSDPIARHIVTADPAFRPIVEAAGPVALRAASGDPFHALLRAITFQQLAGRAASAIHGRVVALFDDGIPSPQAMLAISQERLRATGLSTAKRAAVLDLAAKFADGTIPTHDFDTLTDDEI